jgi:hypothetical protein
VIFPRRPRPFWLLVPLLVAAACYLTRVSMDVPRGLRGAYFPNADASGTPVMQPLDEEASSAQVRRNWRGAVPPQFSVRWFGFLTVLDTDTYTFSLTSDDGSALIVDGERVLENPGPHNATTVAVLTRLERGVHQVALEFSQEGEDYVLSWDWARYGDPLSPVPSWALSPRGVTLSSVATARRLDVATIVSLLAALATGCWIGLVTVIGMDRRQGDAATAVPVAADTRLLTRPAFAALGLFVVLTVVHTWPLASDPAHLSRNDNADTMLNEWIVSWVAHQLPRHPLRLFDANIFHPEPDTLAFSESLIVQGLMAMPLVSLGASPVLTYNLLVIAGFALSAWSMALLVRRWTYDWTAALVSGAIFGFNAHTLTRLPHMQALHVEFLPMALLALDELLRRPGIRQALTLAGWFVLQALASVHLFVFSAFALAASACVAVEHWWGRQLRARIVPLLIAAGVSMLALSPFLWPYWRASRTQDFTRSIGVVAMYSATLEDYLSTPARLHFDRWSSRYFFGTALFPGALALALAAIAIARGAVLRNPRARMCLAIAVTGFVLSFGVKVPGYTWLYELLPPLQAIRAVVRFGYLAIVGVAALAGFGVVALRPMLPRAAWPVVSVVLVIAASLESLAAPIGYRPFDGLPAIYGRIPASATAVVELPFYDVRFASLHAPYMLNSTLNWQPIVNGYSGFQPRSFSEHADALRGFPDARAFALLKELGVRYVFVHADKMSAERMEAIRQDDALTSVAAEGSIELFRIR